MIAAVEQVELAAAATWSPDASAVIDGWRVSSNGGFTRRLNSATAVGTAETSLEAKRAVATWLDERNASLVVRVTPLTDPGTAESCARNWFLEASDETIVMSRPIDERHDGAIVRVVDPLDDAFVDEFFGLNGRTPIDTDTWPRMIGRLAPDATGLSIDGTAVGFVAVSGQFGFTYCVAVDPAKRRGGNATAIMAAANRWASQLGARTMVLQVLGTNEPARRLYEHLGFTEMYRYHYLQAVTGGQGST